MARVQGPVSNPAALSAFHVSIDPGTECDYRLGSSGAGTKKEMARLRGIDLNALFDTLADWNDQLKDVEEIIHSTEFGGPQP